MEEIKIQFEAYDNWDGLADTDRKLIEQAYEVAKTAYAPYSKFNVGAAALLSNGQVVLGSNQENIAYPSGICAERVALFAAGANFPNEKVDTIAIVAKGDLLPFDKVLSPCGACRQVMLETEVRQQDPYRVILVSQNGKTIVFHKAQDLLPFAFGVS